GHIGDVHSCVVLICGCVQFVPGAARTTSDVKNASVIRILLNVLVDAIAGRCIEAVPPTMPEFVVPQVLLDLLGPISLKHSAYNISELPCQEQPRHWWWTW